MEVNNNHKMSHLKMKMQLTNKQTRKC